MYSPILWRPLEFTMGEYILNALFRTLDDQHDLL